MKIIQVTLTAVATPIVAQSATQNSTQLREMFQILIFQNNSTHSVRVGDASVSATKGLVLASGSTTTTPPLVIAPHMEYSGDLSEWYLFGTAGDLIDVMYLV